MPLSHADLLNQLDYQIRVNRYLKARTRMDRKGALLTQDEMAAMQQWYDQGKGPEDFGAWIVKNDEMVARAAGIVNPDSALVRSRRDPQTESPSYRNAMRDAGRMR